nr:very short patch repair endonuclease [Ruegeria sp. HKCCA5426]
MPCLPSWGRQLPRRYWTSCKTRTRARQLRLPADRISADRRSENMRRIKSQHTKPEMIVRRLVHSLGYRYRLHKKGFPGRPDLVFGPKRKAIFVHGCFWHSHDDPNCPHSHVPKSRLEYWKPKLERTRERDKKNRNALEGEGWAVLEIWECETKDRAVLKKRLVKFLG